MIDSSLLQPTLRADETHTIHSVGALIAAAFFGGPGAVLIVGTINSHRQRLVTRDLAWLVPAAVATCAALGYFLLQPASAGYDSDVRLVSRIIAFLLVGAFWLAHRRTYRSMTFLGNAAPSPWITVIIAVIAGAVMLAAAVHVFSGREA